VVGAYMTAQQQVVGTPPNQVTVTVQTPVPVDGKILPVRLDVPFKIVDANSLPGVDYQVRSCLPARPGPPRGAGPVQFLETGGPISLPYFADRSGVPAATLTKVDRCLDVLVNMQWLHGYFLSGVGAALNIQGQAGGQVGPTLSLPGGTSAPVGVGLGGNVNGSAAGQTSAGLAAGGAPVPLQFGFRICHADGACYTSPVEPGDDATDGEAVYTAGKLGTGV